MGTFWNLYFMFANSDNFHLNYMEAWRQKFAAEQQEGVTDADSCEQAKPKTGECSVILFRDNTYPLLVPCRWDMSDEQFIRHIRNFHYLQRLEGGFGELFSLKTINFVEVVELEHNLASGFHQYYLNLARHGSSNRLIRFWIDPVGLKGNALVTKLTKDMVVAVPAPPAEQEESMPTIFSVIFANALPRVDRHNGEHEKAVLGDHKMALNVVTLWNTDAATVVVSIPLVFSLIIGIVWTTVGVIVYDFDVNESVTAGFTLSVYLLTAGAILIALVAFMDSQNEKRTKPVR
jgi:hypothetical protein